MRRGKRRNAVLLPSTRTLIARLDRAIQYSEAAVIHGEAAAYWIPRLRGHDTELGAVYLPLSARALRRRLLARLVDRDVLAVRQRRRAVGNHQRVELDEAVAFLLVISRDFRSRGDLVTGACG